MAEIFVINEEIFLSSNTVDNPKDLQEPSISTEESGKLEEKAINYVITPAEDSFNTSEETSIQIISDSQKEMSYISDSVEDKYEPEPIVLSNNAISRYESLSLEERIVLKEKLYLTGQSDIADALSTLDSGTSNRVPEKGIDNIDDPDKQDAVFAEIARQAEIEEKLRLSKLDLGNLLSDSSLNNKDNSLDIPDTIVPTQTEEDNKVGDITSKAGFFDGGFDLDFKTLWRDKKGFIITSIVVTALIIFMQRK